MSDRVYIPGQPDRIIRGSGVWTQSLNFITQLLNSGSYVVPYCITPHPAGGVVVGAGIDIGGVQRAAVIRVSSSGTVSWCRTLTQGASTGAVYKVAVLPSGSIAFAGRADNPGTGFNNLLVGVLTAAGAVSWFQTYDGGVNLSPSGLDVDASGNLYATTGDSGLTTAAFAFTSAGAVLWQRSVNWGTNTGLQGVAVDSVGGVVYSGGGQAGELIGLSVAAGATVWSARYNPSAALNNQHTLALLYSGGVLYGLGETDPGGALGAGVVAYAVNIATSTLLWDQHIACSTAVGSRLGEWQLALRAGVLYGVGNTAGGTVQLVALAFNAATGAVQYQRTISNAASQQLSACAIDSQGVWLGWSDGTAPSPGEVACLPSSGSWPLSLAAGAYTVATSSYTVTSPGSSIAVPAWGNGPGTFISSALPLVSGTATLTATTYPVG